MKTYSIKKKDIQRSWHLIDAKDAVLGRMCTKIAFLLTGKHKVGYTPHIDMGDFVVVINSKDVKVTGRKEQQKIYYRHSGYPSGLKKIAFAKLICEQPEKIIKSAVRKMLPDNKLRDKRMARLKVFASEEHKYAEKFRKEKAGAKKRKD